MSLAVVRCPACGGASRVPLDALGQMVGCPRCQTPFVADADAPAAPAPTRQAPPPVRTQAKPVRGRPTRPDERPRSAVPIAPPRAPQTGAPVAPQARQAQDHEHDPVTPPTTAGLPLSVMVGFALMPFGIPLLWLLGPLVTGFDAALSVAVPASLAVAAAALCLGIVHTIDWTGTTRLKGVLILVGLSYMSAAGLYFLKPELMARVQKAFAVPVVWVAVGAEPRGDYYVKMPVKLPDGGPVQTPVDPFAGVKWAVGQRVVREAYTEGGVRNYTYLFAVSHLGDQKVLNPDDAWFASFGRYLTDSTKWQIVREEKKASPDNHPGREWELRAPDGETVRIVRVFVIQGRVYYLSAEGPGLTPEDNELAKPFFDSFARISKDPKK